MRTNKELVSIVLRAILVISLFAWITCVVSAEITYDETNRCINGTNVTVNTTGAFNRSYNVTTDIPLWFQINNSLNTTADSFNVTNETGLTTNGGSDMSNVSWFWVNAGLAGTYWVNVTNNNNTAEYVNFTVVYSAKGAWNDTNGDTVHNANESFWENIQDTIDNTNAGSTIVVHDGTYTESVNVSKQLTIQSESDSASTIVNASVSTTNVFNVTADYVNISGFTVQNATALGMIGIHLNNAEHCNISGNIVTNNFFGIFLNSSSNNTLTSNTADSNSDSGIFLLNSSNNTLTSNTADSNTNLGIFLNSSSNNALTSNTANSNSNIGIFLNSSSNNNTLTSNTASSNTNFDFYSDENSHNNTVEDLMISSYLTTISFTYGDGIMIKGVTTPNSDPSGKVNIGKFVNATNVTANSWLFLNVSYSAADVSGIIESTLKMYKWSGTAWGVVSGVNDVNEAGNYVYANITSFSQIAPFGDPTPTAAAARIVGGGRAAPSLGLGETSVSTESTGEVTSTVAALSADEKAVVTIYKETIAKDAGGNPLTKVTVTSPSELPSAAPSGVYFVGKYVYNFGPEGATFSKPVEISITFDPADFPAGTTPVIHTYEAGAWKALATTVVGNKATAQVTHFSTFVLFAGEKVTPTPTPTATPTPTPTATPTATPTPTPKRGIPGFEIAVFAIAGLLVVAYLVLRRRKA